jgi:hypothetical protein
MDIQRDPNVTEDEQEQVDLFLEDLRLVFAKHGVELGFLAYRWQNTIIGVIDNPHADFIHHADVTYVNTKARAN